MKGAIGKLKALSGVFVAEEIARPARSLQQLTLKTGLNMGKKSQKSRLSDVKRSRQYFSELADKFDKFGRLSIREVNTTNEILAGLKQVVRGRLGKHERELVKTARALMSKVESHEKSGSMSENDVKMWAFATGTWRVIEEQMIPINQQAIKELMRYRS